MRRSTYLVAFSLALLAGCGGGGGTIAGGGGGQDVSIGSMQARASSGTPTPLIIGFGNSSFFAMSGATFNRVTYTPAKILANTRIAFGRSGGNLWTCDPSGGHLRQVTTGLDHGGAILPTWSPDAFRLAFLGLHAGYGLYVVGANGSSFRSVTTPLLGVESRPAWSPTGTVIAFSAYDAASGFYQIYTAPANGGAATKINGPAHNLAGPTYNSNATKIAYTDGNDTNNIYTMNADGSNPVAVTTGGGFTEPQYSPDGTQIAAAWNDGTHVQIVRIKDGIVSNLTNDAANGNYSPSWSPDGRMIAYSHVNGILGEIWTMAEDGSDKKMVLNAGGDYYQEPAWSPFPVSRTMIGTGGLLSATPQAGFVFSQDGNTVTSFLSFNAPTPGTTIVESKGNNGLFQTFNITGGGGINSLKYTNDLLLAPIAVLPGSGFTSAAGIMVTMNATDGTITLVMPYSKMNPPVHSKSGTTYTGQFLGAYDAKGRNLAPNGASTLELSSAGKLVSAK